MNTTSTSAREAAIAWAVRTHADSFDDWGAFTEWLAADPDHAKLYDRATIAAEEAVFAVQSDAGQKKDVLPLPSRRRFSYWILGALAAGIVAATGGAWLFRSLPHADLYEIATKPGEMREINLDAVHIALDSGSRITLDRHNERFARLDVGEALFTVAHDSERPFRLQVGAMTITDIGTSFDVERQGDATIVKVAEGSVRIAAAGGTIDAGAGQAVTFDAGRASLVRREQDPALVGAWRQGRIDFADVPIAQLAGRLQRATGMTMTVAPDLQERRVSGSIQLGPDRAGSLRQLAGLLDISIRRRGDAWIWSEDAGAGTS